MRFASLLIAAGGFAGALAVTLGAIGAHALRARLPVTDYEVFTLGAEYLLVHAVAICVCGVAARSADSKRILLIAGLLLTVGIVLFSGGLMGRAALGMPVLGRVAPVGGTMLIAGWFAVGVGGLVNFPKRER